MTHNLNYYLRLWNLGEPELLARTPTSHVYGVTRGGEVSRWFLAVARNAENHVDLCGFAQGQAGQ